MEQKYHLRVHTSSVRSPGCSCCRLGIGGGSGRSRSSLLGSGNDAQSLHGLCIGQRLKRLERRLLLFLSFKPRRRKSRGQQERRRPDKLDREATGKITWTSTCFGSAVRMLRVFVLTILSRPLTVFCQKWVS